MTKQHNAIHDFWQSYLISLPEDSTHDKALPESWAFGEGAEMADELGGLAAAGIKTATCSLLFEYETEGSEIPKLGDLSIILDGEGFPLCLVETAEVKVKRFDEVDARFAYDEGEGDRSFENWYNAHTNFFTRTCEELGCCFSEDLKVIW